MIDSSANISSEVTQVRASSALIAVSISWQACSEVLADLTITYFKTANQSDGLPLSVMTQVILPASRIFVPLNELRPETRYEYSISLVSDSGGLTLGLEEQVFFDTATEYADIITQTVTQTVCTISKN